MLCSSLRRLSVFGGDKRNVESSDPEQALRAEVTGDFVSVALEPPCVRRVVWIFAVKVRS